MVEGWRIQVAVGAVLLGVGVLAGLAQALGGSGDDAVVAGSFGALGGFGLATLLLGLRNEE